MAAKSKGAEKPRTEKKEKKRRVRSPHPGVKLKPRTLPSGVVAWRALFVDPDTHRPTYVTLDAKALPNARTREQWAITKSKSNARRRMELESGAPRKVGTELSEIIDRYFEAHPQLSDRTREDYRAAADSFLEWAKSAGVLTADDVTRARLMAFREAVIRRPKQATYKGSKRGGRKTTGARRAPESVNAQLRKLGTVLRYLRSAELLPSVSSDDLRDGLKRLKVSIDAPEFLRPEECRQLLDAALRHDAAVFAATRDEHRQAQTGATERYDPVAPFVATVLLGGFRLSEALGLRWMSVLLDTTDAEGKPKGEIRLKAAGVKTRTGRVVSLGITPRLRELLTVLHENKGSDVYVFGGKAPLSKMAVEAARRRLIGAVVKKPGTPKPRRKRKVKAESDFGAPKAFSWQLLRSTCATIQTNAKTMFGDAAAWASARRLGHSVLVAERRYAGNFDVPRDATTLEAAMGIDEQLARIIAGVVARGAAKRVAAE